MFEFAFKKVKPATENMVVVENSETVSDHMPNSVMETSAALSSLVSTSLIYGIVKAFACRLAAVGTAKEKITELVNVFIQHAAASGDLDAGSVKWLQDEDWYKRSDEIQWKSRFQYDAGQGECMWRYAEEIMSEGNCSKSYAADFSRKERSSMTEEERTILENFDKAQAAYWTAYDAREKLLRNKVRQAIKSLLLKYSEDLDKLDHELYHFLANRFECTVATEEPDPMVEEVAPAPIA